jgi:hypothetical protein
MTTGKRPPAPMLAVLVAAGVVLAQALLVPLFAGVAANSGTPRDLPVVVAGPTQATSAFAEQLEAGVPGGFDIIQMADPAAADREVRERYRYAAFVLDPSGGVSLHTASAASPAVAQLLTQAVGQLGPGEVEVVDLVPGSPDDPRGTGFSAGFLPLALTSMLAGIALAVLIPGRLPRLLGLLTFAVLAGVVGAAVLDGWLGVLNGDFLASAAAIGLLALAIAGAVAGLGAAFGGPGIGIGAVLVFLVGNPLSAAGSAPELLPQPWGAVGQWLPVGAGATLLRSATWFDWAGSALSLVVLGGWALLGLLLVLVGRARIRPPR